MKPLYQGIFAGSFIAIIHIVILKNGWTLWDVSMVSVSSLSAGIFFILGMIFTSTLQDYKQANMTIVTLKGKMISMQDLNLSVAHAEPGYDPSRLCLALLYAAQSVKKFVENSGPVKNAEFALASILDESFSLRNALPGAQTNLLLKMHEEMRHGINYLSFIKNHNFPVVGYAFLWFFTSFIIALQLFSETTNILLDSLFIFSLSSILVFFIAFLRDLDSPFLCHMACFTLDSSPLGDAITALSRHHSTFPNGAGHIHRQEYKHFRPVYTGKKEVLAA